MASRIILASLVLLLVSPLSEATALTRHYYSKDCPKAEAIVAERVKYYFKEDATVAAPLLRLHFHDCFVHGCDASVLLKSTAKEMSEQMATPNFKSLGAFNVVDDIKKSLEKACPGIVSCADILALAAREGILLAGGPLIPTVLGRRDSLHAYAAEAVTSLPGTDQSVAGLDKTFAAVGLDQTDMVTLAGGHTIGQAHCSKITERLSPTVDPTLSPTFASQLQKQCKNHPSYLLSLDRNSQVVFDNHYYKNLLTGAGLLKSDTLLALDSSTKSLVKLYASNQTAFFQAFVKSMLKMGANKPLTGTLGEIRKVCGKVN